MNCARQRLPNGLTFSQRKQMKREGKNPRPVKFFGSTGAPAFQKFDQLQCNVKVRKAGVTEKLAC